MGQRHQAFMVACIVPYGRQTARYRCIGALHQQWCYGSLPLLAALRFLTLIKQPENLEVIREEMRALDGLYGCWLQEPKLPQVPCPFTQFLLGSAWSVDLDDPVDAYSAQVLNLWADMGPKDGDNNDGITVMDITDPENPTYCFIIDIYNSDLIRIPAKQYILEYYPDYRKLETLVYSFDAIPLMSKDVVDEAWSTGKSFSDAMPLPKSSIQEIPSLVEFTLKPAVEQAIAVTNADILSFILLDSNRVAIAKSVIRSQNPVSDGAFALVQKLQVVSVQKDKIFDLSGFHLSGKQIVDLLALCEGSEVASLKLSHNTSLKISDLERILQAMPKCLRRLVLWNTGISDAEISMLLVAKPKLFYRLESIIHPAFLLQPTQKGPAGFIPAFTQLTIGIFYLWSVSIPYFTPNTLAQGLVDYLGPIRGLEPAFLYSYDLDAQITAMAAYGTSSRFSETTWGERSVTFIPRTADSRSVGVTQLRKGEWVFFFNHRTDDYPKRSFAYAFMRANKDGQELLSDENSPKTKTKDNLLKRNLVDVFDVRGFFKELEFEGRPSPDPKVLDKLFGLFSVDTGDKLLSFIGYEGIIDLIKLRQ